MASRLARREGDALKNPIRLALIALLAIVLVAMAACGASPGSGGAQGEGTGAAGDAAACAFEPSDDPHEAFTRLDARHQELTAELEADLETAETMEEQQEIYAAIAAVDEACLAVLSSISFPSSADSVLRLTVSALEDLAASRRDVADAATEEEFEDAVAATESALVEWRQWRNTLLLALPRQ